MFIQLRTVVLNFQNVLQHNMTSAQIISRYFTHKKCTEKFRMNCCPMLEINEHSAWYQNVWILAVTGRFPVEYILVCCTLNTPRQSTKSVCEFETQICFDFDNCFYCQCFYLFHSFIVFVEKFGQQTRTWAVVKARVVSSPVQEHHSQ